MTLLTALVIGSCVTCTDPILSQAVAKDLKGVNFKEAVTAGVESGPSSDARRDTASAEFSKAIEQWIVEGWIYTIVMSVFIGAVIGYGSMFAIKFGLRKKYTSSPRPANPRQKKKTTPRAP
ncbi:hypothetical protein BDV95DRAFT_603249 [Massariosphaeria phaeospora]|uniref:Uncharacterized protein n=1 Tax=Massariosphaeria phaeospora TaxID=100035 RepID=A0A7C8MSF9_9PLEO|nr:hypothetical protein BDV95DRAFT_603249 [Massariosphaeria phaeospora]